MLEKLNGCIIYFNSEMSKWNRLLKEIAKFLNKYSCNLSGYEIILCHTGNAPISIKLSLFSQKNDFTSLLDKYFNKIFIKERSKQKMYQIFRHVIQQDINNENMLKYKWKFQKALSNIVITNLCKDIIDKNTIFSFGYYLHLILMKVFVDNFPNSYNAIVDNYDINFGFKNVDIKILHSICDENFRMSYDMVEEIFSDNIDSSWTDDIVYMINDYLDSVLQIKNNSMSV